MIYESFKISTACCVTKKIEPFRQLFVRNWPRSWSRNVAVPKRHIPILFEFVQYAAAIDIITIAPSTRIFCYKIMSHSRSFIANAHDGQILKRFESFLFHPVLLAWQDPFLILWSWKARSPRVWRRRVSAALELLLPSSGAVFVFQWFFSKW